MSRKKWGEMAGETSIERGNNPTTIEKYHENYEIEKESEPRIEEVK